MSSQSDSPQLPQRRFLSSLLLTCMVSVIPIGSQELKEATRLYLADGKPPSGHDFLVFLLCIAACLASFYGFGRLLAAALMKRLGRLQLLVAVVLPIVLYSIAGIVAA